MSEWISVENRLPEVKPKDCEYLLASSLDEKTGKQYVFGVVYLNCMELETPDGELEEFTGWHYSKEHEQYDGYYVPVDVQITHWMPLPEPPVIDAAKGEE